MPDHLRAIDSRLRLPARRPVLLSRITLVAISIVAALTACTKPAPAPSGSGTSTTATATTSPTSQSTSPGAPSSIPATATSKPSTPPTTQPPTTTPPTTKPPTTKPPTTAPPTTSQPPSPPWTSLYGKEWSRIPTTKRVVALTFDAGANADGVASILGTLAAKRVRASFFLTGNWVNAYPAQAQQIASLYRIGDHSVNHPYFTQLDDASIRQQVQNAAAAIKRVTGADPAPWFRFPYGDRNARTIAAVNSVGFVSVSWTVDTLGWEGSSSGITRESILERVLNALVPGEIVLMHVGSHPTDHSTMDAAALPLLIDSLKARGYTFVTLDAFLS